MNPWIRLVYPSQVPPEGVIVETKIDDEFGERNVQQLIRHGKLWYMTNSSMYVYYEPTHWRDIATQSTPAG